MNRLFALFFISLVQIALSLPHASATEYFADALHGSDANSGLSIGTAKATLQAAVDLALAPGDQVTVLPGEYLTGFIMSTAQNGVTLRALGEVRISSATQSEVFNAADVHIEGISFAAPAQPFQMLLAGSSNIVIRRCRFIQGLTGLTLGNQGNSNVVIRECLFDEQSDSGLFYQGSQSGVVVERCTFGRNGRAVTKSGGGDLILVRNSAIFENAAASTTSAVFSFCNFFGELSAPGGNNITTDPLFIAADHRVYYVRSGSPLLNQGQDGGPIGAFGQGSHTSKDVDKDEPVQAGTPWGGWIDSNGNALSSSSLVELTNDVNGHQEVVLKVGVTSAAIYSPVFDTGSPFTVLRSVDFAAFEDTTLTAGTREMIDQTQATPQREVRVRFGPVSFPQNPLSGPPFQVVDKQVTFKERAQFVQLELVLRRDGN